jgi:hypothetical protein
MPWALTKKKKKKIIWVGFTFSQATKAFKESIALLYF